MDTKSFTLQPVNTVNNMKLPLLLITAERSLQTVTDIQAGLLHTFKSALDDCSLEEVSLFSSLYVDFK